MTVTPHPHVRFSALSLLILFIAACSQSDSQYERSKYPVYLAGDQAERRAYTGDELTTIAMPCGGIATGQLYVRGDGTLSQWWIFNDAQVTGQDIYEELQCYRTYTPDSPLEQGFAVRMKTSNQSPMVYRLDKSDFNAIEFTGEYPIAHIQYKDSEKKLPAEISTEVFSPFIPLNTRDSAIPVTVYHFKVTNTSEERLEISIGGWLENGVGSPLGAKPVGSTVNQVSRKDNITALNMTYHPEAMQRPAVMPEIEVFEDFEDGTLNKWKHNKRLYNNKATPIDRLGKKQEPFSGAQGQFLLNTAVPSRGVRTTLTSESFVINKDYITFLIGGGHKPTRLGLQLLINDEIVRDATGTHNDDLIQDYWNVSDLIGQEAQLRIIDDSRTWRGGQTLIDHICFSTAPPTTTMEFPEDHRFQGSMTLAALDDYATAAPYWQDYKSFADDLYQDGRLKSQPHSHQADLSTRHCGALSSAAMLAPGESKEFTFLISWYFPNRSTWASHEINEAGHSIKGGYLKPVGNMYRNWFDSARDVTHYVGQNYKRLYDETRLFRDSYFDTTLPYWFIQRLAMPVSTLATETCEWWTDGRFYAWEGVETCGGTCTHVWNYEQACARLFPELSRSTRLHQDLDIGFHDNGLVGFRAQDKYAADGQLGTVLKLYREHLMSADDSFLKNNWSKIQKVLEYSIGRDGNEDGVIEDKQHNTYDLEFYGPNTFIGSLYLAALRAGEEMAKEMGDQVNAKRYRQIFEKGQAFSSAKLFNGEYYEQILPADKDDYLQYVTGCLADQLFGQSWAHQLDLGYLYPVNEIKSTLASIFKYNWTDDTTSFHIPQKPWRRYVDPGEPGLFTTTWPRGGEPEKPMRYAHEVWTGIEYQVASHMFYEGLNDEAFTIVRAIHDRYDGRTQNPWNEVECGDHYARAMASWGCLLGASGFSYHGPDGILGFAPTVTPDQFRAFFSTAEGWGNLTQVRQNNIQSNKVEIKWGQLILNELRLEKPEGFTIGNLSLKLGDEELPITVENQDGEVRLKPKDALTLKAGDKIEARMVLGASS